jgi:uncharacterized membrane protein YbhN (UPF0104 family)
MLAGQGTAGPTDATAMTAPKGAAQPAGELSGLIDMEQIRWITMALVCVATLVLAILILGGKSVDRLIRWGGGLPLIGPLVEKTGRPLRMFHTHPVGFLVSIVMSVGVQSLLAVSFFLAARGLYSDPPTLIEHFVIVPIGMLASALPITPAGVGVLELVVDALYRAVPASVTKASGTLVALAFEVVKVILAVLGTLFYWTANAEERRSLEIAEEESHIQPLAPA